MTAFELTLLMMAAAAQLEPDLGFTGIWTRWSTANREALRAETDQSRPRVHETAPSAGEREDPRALGTRVGEIVRMGDCEEGERIARAAEDFALVRAVRAHCSNSTPARASSR